MNKLDPEFTTMDEYISMFSKETQKKLNELRRAVKKVLPAKDTTETITYKMPTFKVNGKSVVYFAGYKTHIGFYPFPSGVAAFREETKQYKTSTGTIQFPLDQNLPTDLIERITKYRLEEVLKKGKGAY